MFTGMKNSEEDDRRRSRDGSTLCTTLRVPTGTGYSFTVLETTAVAAAAADPLTHDGTCKDRLIVHHASIIWTLGVMLCNCLTLPVDSNSSPICSLQT